MLGARTPHAVPRRQIKSHPLVVHGILPSPVPVPPYFLSVRFPYPTPLELLCASSSPSWPSSRCSSRSWLPTRVPLRRNRLPGASLHRSSARRCGRGRRHFRCPSCRRPTPTPRRSMCADTDPVVAEQLIPEETKKVYLSPRSAAPSKLQK
uniref:Uncharacterized protein n=1 Tax=Mycena chlorophos TaxID=658473 RepID=A0ABQ0L808_MYCCL|nr:predicted protein [Mycena chlorophos]